MKDEKYKPSEGEELIKEYFDEENIKYEQQKEIFNLLGDKYSKRIADFYLLKYKVYLEFLGNWNNAEKKEEYNLKKKVYSANNIPCIYIYPDNLGVFDWIFKRRLKKVLQTNSQLKFQLFLLNLEIFMQESLLGLFIIGLFIYLTPAVYGKILLSLALILFGFLGLNKSFLKKV